MTCLDLFAHQMRDHLGIGLAFEGPATRGQFVTQLLEILDNAVVDERHFARGMGMRVARRRRAMRGPAGMRDADIAGRVVGFQHLHEIGKLPLGAPADKLTARHRANPGGIIPPILHPL